MVAVAVLVMPQALNAGSAPLDHAGRVHCDATGRITATDRERLGRVLAMDMDPGSVVTIPAICPAEHYFPTGVLVTPGATYQISAQGLWKDSWITVGPQGWYGLLLEAWNRLPWRRFFLLCGSIGRSDEQAFAIGASRRWRAPDVIRSADDRQLYLFANDWPSKYDNNRAVSDADGGPMRVAIQRIK